MQIEISQNLRALIYDCIIALPSDMSIHDRWRTLYFHFYEQWNIDDLHNVPEIKAKKISKIDYLALRPHLMAKLFITMYTIWSKTLGSKIPENIVILTDM